MTRSKTTLLLALFAGASLTTFALAEMGPGGPGGDAGSGQKLLEMFGAIDTDGDGKLSLDELEAHRAAEFSTADKNGDGALDADELSAQMLARVQEHMAERIQHVLDNKDSDGSGTLSVEELGDGPGVDHFARIDTDNDGLISQEEAETAMQHRKKRRHGMDGWGMGSDEG